MQVPTSNHVERRSTPRVALGTEALLLRAGEATEALTKDIGSGGVCLVFGESVGLAVGEQVAVRFSLPALAEPCEVEAIVRWVGGPGRVMVGLQFTTGLRAREVWAINQLASDD